MRQEIEWKENLDPFEEEDDEGNRTIGDEVSATVQSIKVWSWSSAGSYFLLPSQIR